MPHIATKINCDGNKCGECAMQREKTVEISIFASLPPQSIFAVVCCIHGDAIITNGNRVAECMAGELTVSCGTCGNLHKCAKLTDCKSKHYDWQPATKGER